MNAPAAGTSRNGGETLQTRDTCGGSWVERLSVPTAMPDHNVRVCARFRPFNDREKAEGALDEMRTKIRGNTIETDSKPFTFDHVFGMETQ